MAEGDVLLGLIVESGLLGATEYYPADHIAEIRDREVRLGI
jgi:hypothetical protein